MTDLEAILYRIQNIDPTKSSPAAVDFGVFDGDLTAHLGDLLNQLWRAVSNYADVETPAAHTIVSWTGNVVTTVANPKAIEAHSAALAQALSRRTTLLRILIATLALVAVPSNPFALLRLTKEIEAALNA